MSGNCSSGGLLDRPHFSLASEVEPAVQAVIQARNRGAVRWRRAGVWTMLTNVLAGAHDAADAPLSEGEISVGPRRPVVPRSRRRAQVAV